MKWDNLKIGKQIAIGFAVCIFMAGSLAAIGYFTMAKLSNSFAVMNYSQPTVVSTFASPHKPTLKH